MIYTLTTNPAIDMNLSGTNIKANFVNRTQNTIYSPNGKGINVTLVLKHFQVPSTVLGFFGGFTGRYIIDELNERGVMSLPIWVEDVTRINIFVNDGSDEYKFVNAGSMVPQDKQAAFLSVLNGLENCEYLVISGSLPQGITTAYYDEIMMLCARKNIKVILDISSGKLKDLLKYQPLLIKPNDEEIKDIFDITIKTEEDAVNVFAYLHAQGAQNVLLTLGAAGSYFSDGTKIYYCSARKVQLVSSACAGDAALGAFLSEWLYGAAIEEALKKSAAAGANVAESEALGDLQQVDAYRKTIQVREVGK